MYNLRSLRLLNIVISRNNISNPCYTISPFGIFLFSFSLTHPHLLFLPLCTPRFCFFHPYSYVTQHHSIMHTAADRYSQVHGLLSLTQRSQTSKCHGFPQTHKAVPCGMSRLYLPLHCCFCQTAIFCVLLPSSLFTVILPLPIDAPYQSQFIHRHPTNKQQLILI
jgi:hypothetical protein